MELFNLLESQYGLPAGLLDSVWSAESGRGRNMRSPKGAEGHFQFMPATAQQYGVADPSDLGQSAAGAARMYADLLKQYGGDLPRALAGYNWGQGNMARKGFEAAPAETRNYIAKVTNAMGQPQARAPQQDAPSDDWATLNAQFAPGSTRSTQESDPWAELGAKFAQPVPTDAPRARAARSEVGATTAAPSTSFGRRAQTAALPLVGPTLAALDINPDMPAIAKGIASGFADLGNTIINRGTKVGADIWAGIDDPYGLMDPRLKRPAANLTNLVTGEKPMSQAERENAVRAASLEDFNRENASAWFSGGRLAGNIAATFPAGGVIAAPVRAAAPVLAPLADALATGGFRTGLAPATLAGRVGNVALRAAGGSATGGATAGLVNPDDAAVGAMIGGVLPPALQGVNKAGDLAGRAYRALAVSPATAAARSVLDVGGFTTPAQIAEVQAALRAQGPAIVGESPTVSQILQNPEISQLERTVRNTPGGAPALIARDQAQNAARLNVLNDVASVAADLPAARTNFGNTIAPRAADARNAASKAVRQAFDAVDPLNDTQFYLPLPEMEAAKAKFLGPGTFGTGSKAQSAIDTATGMGTEMRPRTSLTGSDTVRKTVPFQTVQNLRSSIGEAAEQARMRGANKEAAALESMKADIDNRVNLVAAGKGDAAENFPADIVAQWRKAIDLHADKQNRFARGPQAGMFRKGGDGNYAVEGGELAPKFFSPRLSQSEDIEALKRMRLGTPVIDSLKSYATTDASRRVTGDGTLRSKAFNDWLNAHGGAVRGLFDDGERARLTGVGVDLKRASDARDLGRATGSNTSQNVQNALGLGMLDSRAVNLLASRTPFVGKFTGPMLDALRESAKRGKAGRLGGLLSDPAELDRAIADYLSQSVRGPGLLGHDSQTVPFLLRSSPLLASDRS
ncbi:lytic transglycosylase domain-containing protein [Variovorax boronicumulans]|uniref:lytic transglycosylase domain-containing protein n=1 Tax=Variovorax boronicumulans TaxID=436515 RepID=UPI000781D3E1|nr:lytic transglycosylase domain-containing protein [Variovorax boronicumulans]